MKYSLMALTGVIEDLVEVCKVQKDALESIAARFSDGQSEPAYWRNAGIEACAETIANDTSMARETLEVAETMLRQIGISDEENV